MRLKEEKPAVSEPACGSHHWRPLFTQPEEPSGQRAYMAEGHGDYLECAECGAIALRDGVSSGKMLTLSASFSNAKKRQADGWNARQQPPGKK